MPKVSKKRSGEIETLRPVEEWLNGKYDWRTLRSGFAFAKAMRTIGPDELEAERRNGFDCEDLVDLPPDEDFKTAAAWLETRLLRWIPQISKTDEVSDPEFDNLLATVLNRLLGRNRKAAVNLLLGKAFLYDPLQRRFPRVEFLIEFVDSPLQYAEATAVRFIQLVLIFPSDRIRQCRRRDCMKYFLNASGQQEYCSHMHAQAAVNEKRKQGKLKRNQLKPSKGAPRDGA